MANALFSRILFCPATCQTATKFYGVVGNSSFRYFSPTCRISSSEEGSVHSFQPSSSSNEVDIKYRHGLPVVTLPLPSRHELCQFTLKPVTHTVGDFLSQIKQEDKGIDIVTIYSQDGTKISNSTHIEHLLQLDSFQLRINDQVFVAEPPAHPSLSPEGTDPTPLTVEGIRKFEDVQAMIGALHGSLHVEEYQHKVEQELVRRLEHINAELGPLEEKKQQLLADAEARTSRFLWAGLGAMGVQFGLFGRLTWWEYSWDIMEPVTYFATYSTVIAGFAYYLVTRTSYDYPDAHSRLTVAGLHRFARKKKFDVDRYNLLVKQKADVEYDLKRLRDPFFLHLPMTRVSQLYGERAKAYGL